MFMLELSHETPGMARTSFAAGGTKSAAGENSFDSGIFVTYRSVSFYGPTRK
jgi:hypothetical protein